MTNEELDALVALIAGSKIDMLQRAYSAITALRAERQQLAEAICGGEDFPGLLASTSVEALVEIARKGQRDHSAMIDDITDLLAERDEWKAAAEARHANPADFRYWEGRYRDEKARALAAEAAALELAAKEADKYAYRHGGLVSAAIRALIKPAARTAMGAALADARREGKLAGGLPADFQALLADAMAEATRAMARFPQPNYVISKFAEESGEVVKAAIHYAEGREARDAVVSEMRQTIAMMLRLWIEGDQVHGMAPLCALAARVEGGAE